MKGNVLLLLCLSVFIVLFHDVGASSHNDNTKLPTVCVNGRSKTQAEYDAMLNSWVGCPWQRIDVINLTNVGFDLNGDGGIDERECNTARHYYFEPYELVWGETCDAVMDHCDCDGDGKIDADDFMNSVFSCIPDCMKAREVYWLLGGRIKDGKAYAGKSKVDDKYMPDSFKHHY